MSDVIFTALRALALQRGAHRSLHRVSDQELHLRSCLEVRCFGASCKTPFVQREAQFYLVGIARVEHVDNFPRRKRAGFYRRTLFKLGKSETGSGNLIYP